MEMKTPLYELALDALLVIDSAQQKCPDTNLGVIYTLYDSFRKTFHLENLEEFRKNLISIYTPCCDLLHYLQIPFDPQKQSREQLYELLLKQLRVLKEAQSGENLDDASHLAAAIHRALLLMD
jgi:hypothetical protein